MSEDSRKCRIALDVFGGDKIPDNPILGAILANEELSDKAEILLVGSEDKIISFLNSSKLNYNNNLIINAPEVVSMEDTPTIALRNKPKSSINVCLDLILNKQADAFVSAGNTGAVMAGATLKLGRIEGISRPTIGTIVPTLQSKTVLFDVGASVDCKPQYLLEYAIMGSIYMEQIFNISNPKIGLLNVGEEKSKGNELVQETYELLSKSSLNFIGNIEGRDILKGEVEVIVCDGFVGNVILKFAEGFLSFLKSSIRNYADKNLFNKIKAGIVKYTLKDVLSNFDYQGYGGVPLLGVKGVTIIGHGSSTPLAIKNMIKRAYEVYNKNVPDLIYNAMKKFIRNKE